MFEINGKTRVCGIFGYPVNHSFSPAMHNAAFKKMGLNWAYAPFPVRPGELPAAMAAIRALNMAGVNITVPHKQEAAGLVDALSPAARLCGAVNTVVSSEGVLTGHNTDGEGFIRALREEAGPGAEAVSALVLGAGGAARAVAVSLALGGAPEIIVANRTPERAEELCQLIREGTGCRATALEWPDLPTPGREGYGLWEEVLGRARLVVQTTPMGMHPWVGELPPFPFNLINGSHVVVDIVYNPPRTAFVDRCREAGSVAFNGLGMLLHQGAAALELWTGLKAPLDVMRRALEKEISGRNAHND